MSGARQVGDTPLIPALRGQRPIPWSTSKFQDSQYNYNNQKKRKKEKDTKISTNMKKKYDTVNE